MSRQSAGLRVGDVERDRAVAMLGEHFALGRLDRAEYDERQAAAFAARTRGDLDRLFGDLPALSVPAPRTPTGTRPPRSRRRLPLLPVLLLLVGLAMLFDAGWLLWVGLGAFFLFRCGGFGRWHRGHPGHPAHTSGRRF